MNEEVRNVASASTASGVYLVRLVTPGATIMRRVTLLR